MGSSSHQPLSAAKTPVGSNDLTSAFSYRFDEDGQPKVYFRKEPDLTSDPNQTWVTFDTCKSKFVNYTPEKMSDVLETTSPQEENDDEADLPSAKRQKRQPTAQGKAGKVSSMSIGFRVDKPVQTKLSDHEWMMIFEECHPSVLLIIRTLNHRFHQLLEGKTIWRRARIKLHGKDMPDPPGNMTEQRYAHLLYGQGCDFRKSKCGSNITKKVYWPFLLRMCDACFRRKTEKDKDIRKSMFLPTGDNSLGDLIPAGMTSSGKYMRTRRSNGAYWEDSTRAVYLRSDLEALLPERQDMVQAGILSTEYLNWKAEKCAQAQALMAQCTRIEDFQKQFLADQPRHREARADFFVSQAANLEPPMGKDVMEKMMAFKMSLDSNHEPTLRSWNDLKNKLLPHRAAAKELLDRVHQNEEFRRHGIRSSSIQNFSQLHTLRSRSSSPKVFQSEQAFVISLGQKELNGCKDRAVADADLVLLVLKGVFGAYQRLPAAERPRGTNIDLSQGTYTLTLDDARMIVQEVIEPEVQSWNNSVRSRETLQRFKCFGCVRKDCTTRYNFDGLFRHIHEKHAILVADGEDFHKLYRPFDNTLHDIKFPWYTVEWPKNLPIAASHQEVSKEKKWLADVDVEYVTAALPETVPAFANRQPFDNPDINAFDLTGNLAYAATKLQPTILPVNCQMRITLQYALDRYTVSPDTPKPTLADFIACLPTLQSANEEFNLFFSCGVCKHHPDIPQSAIHTRPDPLFKLQEHFQKTHSTTHDWATSFMDLPSDTELARHLQEADEQLRKEKRAAEEREASLVKNPRKKKDPMVRAVLQRPEAGRVFAELFPRVGE